MPTVVTSNPVSKTSSRHRPARILDKKGNEFSEGEMIHCFSPAQNYTNSFGFQWNKFSQTQSDKAAKLQMSKARFFAQTGWDKEDLSGQNILEVGSGAGRFTEVLLEHTNAIVHSVDFSTAVEANYKNNGPHERLHLYQASVYELPFAPAQFDKVFCFGVLQHTPNPERTVRALISMLRPGGELVIDFYPIKGWWTRIQAKYILRRFTKKMDHGKLFRVIDRNAGLLISTYRFFSRIGVGKVVNRFLPVCDIDGTLPANLDKMQLREMVVLDTFDMFSPKYDKPQRIATVKEWFAMNGLIQNWGGFIYEGKFSAAVVKGRRPLQEENNLNLTKSL